ncbi:hypothetical protein DFO83_101297 [Idiomarina loihiensis]|uniref:hypothetical protein n=1 Tax=Idiomarina TaxID=135575 RepID=UPI000D71D2FC|nr:hypothetical protein [Idiomarina]PWW41605.1 hypothetical protein DFO83_101297 [Idiomarina loihiensis]TDP50663.1 hypothetical protein DET58_101297 [Idiomarina loihiensis]TDS25059.1 hypothetical protein DET62_101142 [Idiomarina sp. H2]
MEQQDDFKQQPEDSDSGQVYGILAAIVLVLIMFYFAYAKSDVDLFVEDMDRSCYRQVASALSDENRDAHDFEIDEVYEHSDGEYTVVGDVTSHSRNLGLYHFWDFACDVSIDDEGNQTHSMVQLTVEHKKFKKFLSNHIPKSSKTL